MKDILKIARKIYRTSNSREARRMVVFLVRSVLNKSKMDEIDLFFHSSSLREKIAEIYPFVYEQPTRAFFYAGSTINERTELVFDHFKFMEKIFKSNIIIDIYSEKEILLYTKKFDDDELSFILRFYPGLRKEGLISLCLKLNGMDLYQMIFWIGEDDKSNLSIFIGAMQGPNGENAKDTVKLATKLCHGYRTKNLCVYFTQVFARAIGIAKIYAVTNAGYYANNHIRLDRKLKTSFSDFWKEVDGKPTDDLRFFELPLEETRKTYEEIPTRKRAVYRRRFELLDDIASNIAKSVLKLKNNLNG